MISSLRQELRLINNNKASPGRIRIRWRGGDCSTLSGCFTSAAARV